MPMLDWKMDRNGGMDYGMDYGFKKKKSTFFTVIDTQLYCVAIFLTNLFIASSALYWPAFYSASSKL